VWREQRAPPSLLKRHGSGALAEAWRLSEVAARALAG
jgi:hypothetical protein